MRELLRDPQYREYLKTPPPEPKPYWDRPLWQVYIQEEAGKPWSRYTKLTYKQAWKIFVRAINAGAMDGCIRHPALSFDPPTKIVRIKGKYKIDGKGRKIQVTREVRWKAPISPDDEDHRWCRFCRRPTVFRYYRKHKGFPPGFQIDPDILRCCICGASERIATKGKD